jgi:nitrile hydratase
MREPPAVPTCSTPPVYLDGSAPAPRFRPGDVVAVAFRDGPGHIRTPWYLRGRTGRVERICGHFPNPEELAFRRSGLPRIALYRVRFAISDLWGGESGDTLDAEIYEHWLEPADAA